MILKLAAALMTALAICLSAPAHADAKSSAPLAAQDVSAYDGTYILEVGRVWRDVYWIDKGNEHYVPGRVDPLARALVRAQGGRLELVEAIEFEKSDGPVFQGFVGSFLDEGVLRFSADVNYLVGKPAPYALTVDFPLSDAIIAGEKAQVEPDGFDAAYRAHVTLQKITGAATPPALPQGQGGDALAENDVLLETAPLLQLPLAQLEAVKKALSLVRWNAESQRMQEWRECPPDALAPLRVLAVFVLKKPSGMSLAECYVRGSNMTLHYSVGPVFSSLGIDLQQQLISVHRSRQGQPFRASQTHSCVDIKDGSVFQSAQHEDGYFTCLPLDSAGRLARAVGGESEGSVGIDKGRLAAEQAERERLATEEVQLQDDPSVGDSAPVSPLSSDLDAILANCRMDYCSWVSVTKRSLIDKSETDNPFSIFEISGRWGFSGPHVSADGYPEDAAGASIAWNDYFDATVYCNFRLPAVDFNPSRDEDVRILNVLSPSGPEISSVSLYSNVCHGLTQLSQQDAIADLGYIESEERTFKNASQWKELLSTSPEKPLEETLQQQETAALDTQSSLLDGLYRPRGAEYENWDCKTVGQDGGALSISGNSLTLIEEACTLRNPTKVDGTTAVSFDAECAIEGTEYEAKISLQKTDSGVVFGVDGFFEEWESCENPSAQTASVVAQDETAELVEESKKFDGTYEITISRLGRDTELQRANNEVNAIEKLAQLTLRSEGGVLSLTTLVDWTKTFGSYQDLSGKFLADGTLQFDATGTVLYGRFEPRRLVFEVLAGEKLATGEKMHLRVEDWDEHWAASIEVRRLTDEDAVREQVAAEQVEQDRLTAEREEGERLAAERAERERLEAELVERERLAEESAEQERLKAERAEQGRMPANDAAAQGYNDCGEELTRSIAEYAYNLGLTRSVPVIESCISTFNVIYATGTSSGAGITIHADFNTMIYEFYGRKMGLSTERKSTRGTCVNMHSQTTYENVERDGKMTCY